MSGGWTDERIDRLKTLYAEGLSGNQIANALGWVSRNAVIGKIHRLGLQRPRTKTQALADNRLKMRAKRPERAPQPPPVAPEPILLPAIPRAVREPVSKRLALVDLTATTCKWPDGDGPFTFCGHDRITGSPYCKFHDGIAFTPAVARLRLPRRAA